MKNRRLIVVAGFGLLLVSLVGLFVMNINIGNAGVSVTEVWRILANHDTASVAGRIIWSIRLPRALGAILLGGALAVSGFMLQTFFGNPLAGPYVLGISSGAKLVVALTMIFFLEQGILMNSGVMILAAFVGSLVCMCFILLISGRVRRMSLLIICGVMIGYICSAVTEFAVTFADDSNIVNLHNWSMGSFSGISWSNVGLMAIVVLGGVCAAFFMSKPMGAYQLGEAYAQNMGVNVKMFRVGLILLSSLLSAVVTAFAGPISFVGIAIPHLMRSLFQTAKPICIVPACFLGGAAACLLCDLIARVAFAPTEISISSVTAIFGAPIVIYMMMVRQRKEAA